MFTVQVEKFQAFIDESREEILLEHWTDLALNQDKVPLDPQWDIYLEREKRGELVMMVMRDEHGELAGYFIGFVAPGLHYQTCLTCTMDIFYVRPKFRHTHPLAGLRLFRATERELRSRGVHRWFVGTKLHKDIGRLFEALKFEPADQYWSKWLGD